MVMQCQISVPLSGVRPVIAPSRGCANPNLLAVFPCFGRGVCGGRGRRMAEFQRYFRRFSSFPATLPEKGEIRGFYPAPLLPFRIFFCANAAACLRLCAYSSQGGNACFSPRFCARLLNLALLLGGFPFLPQCRPTPPFF